MGTQDVGIVDAGGDCHKPCLVFTLAVAFVGDFVCRIIQDKGPVLQKKEAGIHPSQGTDHIFCGDQIFRSRDLRNRFLKGDRSFRFSGCRSCFFLGFSLLFLRLSQNLWLSRCGFLGFRCRRSSGQYR